LSAASAGQGRDALPAGYRAWRGTTLGEITDALEQRLLLELIGAPAGLEILDVGCGDGALAITLGKRGARVTGIDASPQLIESARKRAHGEGEPIAFDVAEAQALPFASGSFDVVVAVTVLCLLEDAGAALREMARVLRPGGRLIIGELGRWSAWAAKRRIRGWLGSPDWRRARFRTAAELLALARHAGLVEANVRGAIYYPPFGLAARILRPLDPAIGRRTTIGAAFLALAATKPGPSKTSEKTAPPILTDKYYGAASAFTPESLLREARRQKGAAAVSVPEICILDPDGDIVRQLKADGRAARHEGWVCYHTDLFVFEEGGFQLGVVGCAVGAPFAVLVAEELFASGCERLISITSSGQIAPVRAPPYFVLIERALRDEGTSYHYRPPALYSEAPEPLMDALDGAFDDLSVPVLRGATWTTDAPFRETEQAIATMRSRGLLAVEMEAAALYAFARARAKPVICFAHVTNQMGQIEGDFEKGEASGTADALRVIVRTAQTLTAAEPGRRLDQ